MRASLHSWQGQDEGLYEIMWKKSQNLSYEALNVGIPSRNFSPFFDCPSHIPQSGRYVATSVTSIHQMENGFKIWSFHGRLLYEASKDRLFQLSWRPRLPSLLPAEREAEILKNLKSYTKRWVEGGGSAASDTQTGVYLNGGVFNSLRVASPPKADGLQSFIACA